MVHHHRRRRLRSIQRRAAAVRVCRRGEGHRTLLPWRRRLIERFAAIDIRHNRHGNRRKGYMGDTRPVPIAACSMFQRGLLPDAARRRTPELSRAARLRQTLTLLSALLSGNMFARYRLV